jgi:glycine/D-amino acid oxidase-like deaminating enzyme
VTPAASADTLIIGQGLAGTLLALALIERGQEVLVADPGGGGAASRAAAGLINPITGQRLARAADLETMLPASRRRLVSVGELLGRTVHRDTRILRRLRGDRPLAAWPKRRTDPAYRDYLEPGPEADAVWIRGGAVVDVAGLLDGVRNWLQARGAFLPEAVDPAELVPQGDGVRWRDRSFGQAVFCRGAPGNAEPWFPDLPLRPVKGQVLEGRAPNLPEHPVHERWALVPLGGDRFRLGATYDRDSLDPLPTPEGAQALATGLPRGAVVTGHLAGIRPGTGDGRPLLGRHPDHPGLAVFTGLGSKGLLLGPHYADRLAEALTGGEPVPAEAAWDRKVGGR